MAIEYNFKYMPLVGKLSGESMVQQTETAINEIAKIVNDNTAQADIINTLAETANSNSVEALEKANEALETSGRVYITETLAVNLDSYCESQLIYINNAFSQNLPVAHKGFLEVKTNDDKTQATQVFADDVDKKFYVRTGAITAETVGDVTTYTASYGEWANIPNSTDLDDYLPLAGGTMSGDIEFSASEFAIKGNDIANDGEISVVGATDNLNGASLNLYGRNHTESGAFELNANNGTLTKTLKGDTSGSLSWDGNELATRSYVDNKANDYLPLSGGTMTGGISYFGADSKTFGIGLSSATHDNIDIGWTYSNKYGAGAGFRSTSYTGDESGGFNFWCTDGNTVKRLIGKPDGTLTWSGTAISLNGHTHSYLPLSGGTMTGVITRNGIVVGTSSETSYTQYLGGTDNTSANIVLYGKNHSSQAGRVTIRAKDGSNDTALYLTPAGGLTWGGLDISPQKLTTVAFDEKNIATGTRTNLGTFTLTKGTWLITATCQFPNNSNGYRYLGISSSSTGDQINRFSSVTCSPASGIGTHIIFSTIHAVSSSTTFYLNVTQTSGSTLTTSNSGVRLFRLSHDA